MKVRVVIGIGNPGKEYEATRHNVGFQVCDRIAARAGATFSKAPYPARVALARIKNVTLILVKPTGYVNRSGEVIGTLLGEHKELEEKLLVVCDDMDLDVGRIRIKPKGGSAGHNGMESIMAAFGHDGFPRLRIGIGRPKSAGRDHVLGEFSKDEQTRIERAVQDASQAVETWALQGLQASMNAFNRRPEEGPASKDSKEE